MQDATILAELRILHRRCEQLTMGNNMLTQAYSELTTRVRAYENLINRGRLLRFILPLKSIEKEIARVKKQEISLQQQIEMVKQDLIKQHEQELKKKAEQKNLHKKITSGKKQLEKILKAQVE